MSAACYRSVHGAVRRRRRGHLIRGAQMAAVDLNSTRGTSPGGSSRRTTCCGTRWSPRRSPRRSSPSSTRSSPNPASTSARWGAGRTRPLDHRGGRQPPHPARLPRQGPRPAGRPALPPAPDRRRPAGPPQAVRAHRADEPGLPGAALRRGTDPVLLPHPARDRRRRRTPLAADDLVAHPDRPDRRSCRAGRRPGGRGATLRTMDTASGERHARRHHIGGEHS